MGPFYNKSQGSTEKLAQELIVMRGLLRKCVRSTVGATLSAVISSPELRSSRSFFSLLTLLAISPPLMSVLAAEAHRESADFLSDSKFIKKGYLESLAWMNVLREGKVLRDRIEQAGLAWEEVYVMVASRCVKKVRHLTSFFDNDVVVAETTVSSGNENVLFRSIGHAFLAVNWIGLPTCELPLWRGLHESGALDAILGNYKPTPLLAANT